MLVSTLIRISQASLLTLGFALIAVGVWLLPVVDPSTILVETVVSWALVLAGLASLIAGTIFLIARRDVWGMR